MDDKSGDGDIGDVR